MTKTTHYSINRSSVRDVQSPRYERKRLPSLDGSVESNSVSTSQRISEIDELLQKPIGINEDEIQTNVARKCGIEREELDRVSHRLS